MECSKSHEMQMAEIDIIMAFGRKGFFVDLNGKPYNLVAGTNDIAAFFVFLYAEREVVFTKCTHVLFCWFLLLT